MPTLSLEQLHEKLKSNQPIEFSFVKKDGTTRLVKGTLNDKLIPKKFLPNDFNILTAKSNFKFFDLEADGWRSLSYDTSTVELL